MGAARTVVDLPARAWKVAGNVRSSALDNALWATQSLSATLAERRALQPEDDTGPGALSRISREECLRLLGTRSVGRLAYIARAGVPDIVPVNYVLDGEDVVFRSGPGPKLQAAERRDQVAFEVDEVDDEGHDGWSVVVVGRARRMTQSEAQQVDAGPEPWASGPRLHLVRITPVRIDGRRLS